MEVEREVKQTSEENDEKFKDDLDSKDEHGLLLIAELRFGIEFPHQTYL